jgi:hypothetical protein
MHLNMPKGYSPLVLDSRTIGSEVGREDPMKVMETELEN